MPAKFEVNLTREAQQDIEQIWSFISEDSPDDARRFIQQLEKQVSTLERFPERCPLISENELMGTRYRHLICSNYRTVFRISKRTVYALRVVHAARLLDPSALDKP